MHYSDAGEGAVCCEFKSREEEEEIGFDVAAELDIVFCERGSGGGEIFRVILPLYTCIRL